MTSAAPEPLLMMQATFLRGSASGLEEDAELAAELETLPDEELETRCRRSGLSKRGGRAAQISRCCPIILSFEECSPAKSSAQSAHTPALISWGTA